MTRRVVGAPEFLQRQRILAKDPHDQSNSREQGVEYEGQPKVGGDKSKHGDQEHPHVVYGAQGRPPDQGRAEESQCDTGRPPDRGLVLIEPDRPLSDTGPE